MNKYRLIPCISLLALVWITSSCSKPYDLGAPCPNYGKTCPQALINNDLIY